MEPRHRCEEKVFAIYDPQNDIDIDGSEFVEANDADAKNEMCNSQNEKVENMDYDAFLNYKYVSSEQRTDCAFSQPLCIFCFTHLRFF